MHLFLVKLTRVISLIALTHGKTSHYSIPVHVIYNESAHLRKGGGGGVKSDQADEKKK